MNPIPWLTNVHRGREQPLTVRQWLDLEVAAAQDGRVDAAEKRFLDHVVLSPDARAERTSFYREAADGTPENPEVEAMRRRDPDFDAKVAALKAHAQSGDLVFWHSNDLSPTMRAVRGSWGPWVHSAVMLDNGMVLDGNWPEGATVSTPEAFVAKCIRRFNGSSFVISRPEVPLDEAQRKGLTESAYAMQGRPFALVTDLGSDTAGSCARIVWDAYRSVGVDLAPSDQRFLRSAIVPADLVQPGVVYVGERGHVSKEIPEHYTSTLERWPRLHLLGLDRTLGRIPGFVKLLEWLQKPLTPLLSLMIRKREDRWLA